MVNTWPPAVYPVPLDSFVVEYTVVSALSVAAAVVFGIGFAYPLVREAAETQAREVLSEQADVVVELIFQNDSPIICK